MSLPEWRNLIDALGPLADSTPDAEYTIDRLTVHYNSWALRQCMVQSSAQQVSRALKQYTLLNSGSRSGVQVWRLTREGLEGRNWHH